MRKQRNRPFRLLLAEQERTALRQLLRTGRTGIWMATRARAVLLAAGAHSVSAIAREVKRDRKWVRLWLSRFQELRIAGLQDTARSGRPPKFSPRRAA
jgi:winged helix-turn helix protein